MSADLIDHERIWLQSAADADGAEGRMWCRDKVWPCGPEEGEPTEYVRADLYAAKETALSEWKTMHGRVVEGFMEVCEAVGVQFDAPEAVACAINTKISNAEYDKRAAEAALSEMRAELGRVKEALKPFARIAEMEPNTPDGESTIVNISRCRNAARAIASQDEGEER